jgi:glutamate dehydrogenase/leucine dehydrogenase
MTAADRLGLDDKTKEIHAHPRHELTVRLPVRIDNSSYRLYTSYRLQHSLTMGPAKDGWISQMSHVNRDEFC